jgi:hypothetical protein
VDSIVAWGDNEYGQCDVPAPNADFVAVAGGWNHGLGLKSDGTVVAWGRNDWGQCDVPAPNADFVAVAGGECHSLGLKSDGTIVAWGQNDWGQCDVPAPNADFLAVAAGSAFSLAIKSANLPNPALVNIVAWGLDDNFQCDAPALTAIWVSIAGGRQHGLAVRHLDPSYGFLLPWGYGEHGQCSVPPDQQYGFVAAACGTFHSLGLRSDGTIFAFGWNYEGQCNVPAPNADFVAVAGGMYHSLGLKSDGTVVAWGDNTWGQCDVPSPNKDFIAVASGGHRHSLGLRSYDTPVETSFYATLVHEDHAVLLRWSLPSCSGGDGLVIYRSLSADGPYSCITPEPLLDAAVGSYADETAWPGGTFWYELRALLASGEEVLATDIRPSITVPGTLAAGIRYVMPNPATTHASIGYALPECWRSARLSVHDVAGRLVRRLDPATGVRGFVTVDWDGTASSGERVASGVYFVRLEVDGAVETQSMVLLR